VALKIAGITRYSVVLQRSFATTRGLSEHAARKAIWRPERLRHREQLFQAIALPSLEQIASRHEHFRHFILISPDFPQPFRQALEAVAAVRSWLEIVEVGAKQDFSDVKPAISNFVGTDKAFVFRLDDDDALAPQPFLDAILAHADSPDGTVLSFDEGYMIRPGWNSVSLVKERIPFVSAGLGVYSRGPDVVSIHDLGNQNKIADKGYPVVHIRGRTWLRSKSDTSDTAMKSWKKWRYLPISKASLERCLGDHFPGLDPISVVDAIVAKVR
jgi:hypothetical protein